MSRKADEMERKNDRGVWAVIAIALAMTYLAHASGVEAGRKETDEQTYRNGFADGMASCDEPSRLEKAAGWLAD